MVESKAEGVVHALSVSGSLPDWPESLSPVDVVEAARAQGLSSLLLSAIEARPGTWPQEVAAALGATRRATLVRTLGQIALAARVIHLLEDRGIRALPLKGVVLAATVYDVESDRPMSDVDVLALERWPEALQTLREAGFGEVSRGDHAWALRDPSSGELLELHRSVTSCPGLFPLDAEALWRRSRPGRAEIPRLPSAEDLLVQLGLHAAFQHGLVLSLVQWLDFRRVLERERIDTQTLLAAAAEARAETPLAAALVVAEAVVAAPLPPTLRDRLARSLPRGLRRWLAPRLRTPLAFVLPQAPDHARVRWGLVSGPVRRAELLWRTLFVPVTPDGGETPTARVAQAARRALRFASISKPSRRAVPAPPAPPRPKGADGPRSGGTKSARSARDGRPAAPAARAETLVPFREELLRECLVSFPWVRLTVTGVCMQPGLLDGEKVHLVHASRRPPRLGDVVLARGPEGLRLHRLVWGPPLAPRGSRWRTMADRGQLLDPPLSPADVLATVVAVERRPDVRPRRLGTALLCLGRAVLVRLGLGARATDAEAIS